MHRGDEIFTFGQERTRGRRPHVVLHRTHESSTSEDLYTEVNLTASEISWHFRTILRLGLPRKSSKQETSRAWTRRSLEVA